MLEILRNIFHKEAIAATFKTVEPLATTVMDTFFKDRPTHPLALIGKAELASITRTVPFVRRDGTPISLDSEGFSAEYIAPLPVKVKVNVTASELNDLKVMMGNEAALEAWRRNKLEQIRRTVRDTCEGVCSVVLATGKITWPVQLEGGRREIYEVDYGAPHMHVPAAKITADSSLAEIYNLLCDMERKIRESGVGGKVGFWCGRDVFSVLLNRAENWKSTVQQSPIRLEISAGKMVIAGYEINVLDETFPEPLENRWVSKLDAKTLMAVADVPGKVWYCATDSISANNAAVPLHVVPVARDDDTGITLIGQAKPLPARYSRATCLCSAVD